MPHLHQSTNDTLRLPIGLRSSDSGEPLTDVVFRTGLNKCVIGCAFVFFAIVRVDVVYLIRALSQQVFSQELRGTELSFIRHDGGVEFARVVVYRNEQISQEFQLLLENLLVHLS